MSLEVLIPMLITGAGTGLTCGISCEACGNPIVNMFLASYLFTHTGQWKQSLRAFLSFHLGKACSVMLLCGLISMLGTVVTDENGNLFGIPMQKMVYFAMLIFAIYLIAKWFLENQTKKGCSGICKNAKREPQRQKHMFLYGWISGMSPCASLVLVLGYASALTAAEAMLVGVCFSLANSMLPLLLLVLLTGILSKEMFREIPDKIRYFQLATYVCFVAALLYQIIKCLK